MRADGPFSLNFVLLVLMCSVAPDALAASAGGLRAHAVGGQHSAPARVAAVVVPVAHLLPAAAHVRRQVCHAARLRPALRAHLNVARNQKQRDRRHHRKERELTHRHAREDCAAESVELSRIDRKI